MQAVEHSCCGNISGNTAIAAVALHWNIKRRSHTHSHQAASAAVATSFNTQHTVIVFLWKIILQMQKWESISILSEHFNSEHLRLINGKDNSVYVNVSVSAIFRICCWNEENVSHEMPADSPVFQGTRPRRDRTKHARVANECEECLEANCVAIFPVAKKQQQQTACHSHEQQCHFYSPISQKLNVRTLRFVWHFDLDAERSQTGPTTTLW